MKRHGRLFRLSIAALSLAGYARAQDWPPALPAVPKPAAAALPAGDPIPSSLLDILPRIAKNNIAGMGADAAALQAWSVGKEALSLLRSGGNWAIRDKSGAVLALDPALGAALGHAVQYLGMTPGTVTHAELDAAALSAGDAAAALFDRAIAQRFKTPTAVVVPEIGGEAVMDGGIEFHEIPDFARPVLKKVAEAVDDEPELARLYSENTDAMQIMDQTGLLGRVIKRWPAWTAQGKPRDQMAKLLRSSVDAFLCVNADAYTLDPDMQLPAVLSQNWHGRYIGMWHIHPPGVGNSGWEASSPPSDTDMNTAAAIGQNIVVAFEPDGYDLYDLSPLGDTKPGAAPDRSKILVTHYRSEAWRRHFQRLFDQAFPGRP